jgi:hypothetical protein
MGMNGYSIINLFVMAKAAVQTTQYQTMGVPNLHSFIHYQTQLMCLVSKQITFVE